MSNSTAAKSPQVTLDLSDVDHRVGQLVGGGQLWEPCAASDIRRWVMALDYPNPIHWDQELAQKSKFGGLVAPQSICVALDYGHGVQPACVGHIAGSHLLFGGEEWWFYGHRVRPGDKLFQERRFYDYKVTDTKFAGPTMFQRGDTVHRTQNGTLVAKERATSIRYLAAEAEKRNMFHGNDQTKKPVWTADALKKIDGIRHDWIMSNRQGISPRFDQVKVGDKLPQRAIGPHSIASFTTEYRAFLFNIWGTFHWVGVPGVKDPWINQDPGWVKGFGFDEEGAQTDPRKRDGLYLGPSRGHIDDAKGAEIGVPRLWLWRDHGRVGNRLSRLLGRPRRHGEAHQAVIQGSGIRGRCHLGGRRGDCETAGVRMGRAFGRGQSTDDQPGGNRTDRRLWRG
jgi:hypothetical protein